MADLEIPANCEIIRLIHPQLLNDQPMVAVQVTSRQRYLKAQQQLLQQRLACLLAKEANQAMQVNLQAELQVIAAQISLVS